MNKYILQVQRFLTVDIWRITPKDVSSLQYLLISIVKKLSLAVKFFLTKGTGDLAAALTYSTLLAIVPICAVVFAVARGFGFSKYIEEWFRNALSGQSQAAEIIIGFVNSYLVHTQSGVILGVGLLFMLWTVLRLTRTIEQTFNNIWQVKHERTLFRTVTDYLAMVFLMPILIVLISGISIFMTAFVDRAQGYMLLAPMLQIGLKVMPFVIMSCVFIGLYIFMPNTKVKLTAAIAPGILAGVAMQVLQLFYIHGQMLLSSYNAIYGSFAALPLFMLWVQISWTICLFGAQLCYTNQNLEDLAFLTNPNEISHRYRLLMSAVLLSKICNRFVEGKKPYTALELKLETNIPIRVTNDLLYNLTEVNLINSSVCHEDHDGDLIYQPAQTLDHITVGDMVDRLEALGRWDMQLDLHEQLTSTDWKHLFDLRKTYLDQLRDVPIRALFPQEVMQTNNNA
ncbi:YihY/virulence factor BrkB family protein [Hoylesella buccalis]|uniref:YihY/virulence factor BrkB family protein n=1 Tax=Hoylesella buccalis TaxID=28127 RepID=UPI001D08BD38|nr:YihY/virulence factor BrkB family protein [Hoylesella buccalis]MCB6900916.1 YihY/virulence factor BrkB family protein [Hoylesella buccalis]UEA62642.1 YihY/virulence factor BrkB family protein [Hoylesella buccalis]UWP50072.1 YihY/virulence factor BrkB family protein [Hoylesella buccalis ATCC 35310]